MQINVDGSGHLTHAPAAGGIDRVDSRSATPTIYERAVSDENHFEPGFPLEAAHAGRSRNYTGFGPLLRDRTFLLLPGSHSAGERLHTFGRPDTAVMCEVKMGALLNRERRPSIIVVTCKLGCWS